MREGQAKQVEQGRKRMWLERKNEWMCAVGLEARE